VPVDFVFYAICAILYLILSHTEHVCDTVKCSTVYTGGS